MLCDDVDWVVILEVVEDPDHVFTLGTDSLSIDFGDGKLILLTIIDVNRYKFDDDFKPKNSMFGKHNYALSASLNLSRELILLKLCIEPLCLKDAFNESHPILWGPQEQSMHSFLFRCASDHDWVKLLFWYVLGGKDLIRVNASLFDLIANH